MGGARVSTLVTLRKCTLGHKREIKTLKFVSASTKGFKGGLAWIKPSKKDMAVQGKRAGREQPVLGAQNGPRMEEDPVGPRHRVAGGPVGYKHGMRDGMGP